MKLKDLKEKIYFLLDSEPLQESALCYIIDSTARKVCAYTKCIKRSAELFFSTANGAVCALLPEDFAAFCRLQSARGHYGRENFEIISGRIRSCALAPGRYELIYFAFPQTVDTHTDGETKLEPDDYICDIVAYGAAMELCSSVYPTDVQRYIRLATEYDERLANAICGGAEGACVGNSFFAERRGGAF